MLMNFKGLFEKAYKYYYFSWYFNFCTRFFAYSKINNKPYEMSFY